MLEINIQSLSSCKVSSARKGAIGQHKLCHLPVSVCYVLDFVTFAYETMEWAHLTALRLMRNGNQVKVEKKQILI